MQTMPPGRFQGCKRGVFALSNWDIPLRRPQNLITSSTSDSGSGDWQCEQNLMVKYSYKANPNSPIGTEVTVKLKDTVNFIKHFDDHWIMVRNEAGEEGYMPTSYVMVMEQSLTSLPWLDKQKSETKQSQESAQWKPYKSAYTPKESGSGGGSTTDEDNHYCSVCEKKFNGPIPYKVHLNSKAHKEEVAVQLDM